ncbi:hypothetical protein AC1031_013218 [Aphanomyces cochlioides]|nr:hypothetical protein AC1031_013218 [Aphanomyces cochlioides]
MLVQASQRAGPRAYRLGMDLGTYSNSQGMASWVVPTPTTAWRDTIRVLLQQRQPQNIVEILCSPKYGVHVSRPKDEPADFIDFGYVDSDKFDNRLANSTTPVRGIDAKESLFVWNSGTSPAAISSIVCLDESHPFDFSLRNNELAPDSQAPSLIEIGLKSSWSSFPIGVFSTWLVLFCEIPTMGHAFDFQSHTFCIFVRLRVAHVHAADMRALTVEAPSFVPQTLRCVFNSTIKAIKFPLEALPLQSKLSNLLQNSIPEYPLLPSPPVDSMQLFKMQQDLHNLSGYFKYYTTLLQKEEHQMAKDMHQYDLFNVRLSILSSSRQAEYLRATLHVPGAIEGRPALVAGSIIRIRSLALEFEIHGVVLEVKETNVTLMLPWKELTQKRTSMDIAKTMYETNLFHVRFTYPREGLRLAYYALRWVQPSMLPRLHPQLTLSSPPPSIYEEHLFPFNSVINERQFQAVTHIVHKSSGAAPYIIFGPPGTGKTITVIEAILQVLQHNEQSSVLAIAPSDAAADILAMRLRDYNHVTSLFRLNWPHRKIAAVPAPLLKFCHTEVGKDIFSIPSIDQLSQFRIIVTTCTLAAILKIAGIPAGHFSHIFVDEACQATEPETLSALSLCDETTHVTLAGDPMQLGPSCRSTSSWKFRLVESYQERLMRLPMYECTQRTNTSHITKLVNNYRSHVSLISLSSKLFYNNELFACADPRLVDSMCQWEELKGRSQFPLLFYGVYGEQQKKLESQSYSNPLEAIKVADVIDSLLASTTANISTKDIAVITPFRQQVIKIRHLLRSRGLGAVNVGTVYNLQGQESKVCIISTVMSSMEVTASDYSKGNRSVPVLSDFKSFNVAITRAQALCIVIGHPSVLSQHPLWSFLMGYCAKNGAFEGDDTEDVIFCPNPPKVRMGQLNDAPPDDPEWHLFM